METYIEHLIKRKTTAGDLAIRYISIFVIVLTAVFTVFMPIMLAVAVILGFVYRYLIFPLTDIEYEFLYVDKSLTVDKIMAKEKRKTVASYDLDRMEILCPAQSYRLGDFKNRDLKETDYTNGMPETEDLRVVMIYEGGLKIVLDLTNEFVKIIQNNAPRKVFTD